VKLVNDFVLSHNQYAVNLDDFRVDEEGCLVRVGAFWFRRRRGVNVACLGYIWDIQSRPQPPWSALEFLERYTDNRYGGTCEGRWDGQGYWGAESPVKAALHLEVLKPMLRNWGQVPPGTSGWWEM
jgi:hypothetical protein